MKLCNTLLSALLLSWVLALPSLAATINCRGACSKPAICDGTPQRGDTVNLSQTHASGKCTATVSVTQTTSSTATGSSSDVAGCGLCRNVDVNGRSVGFTFVSGTIAEIAEAVEYLEGSTETLLDHLAIPIVGDIVVSEETLLGGRAELRRGEGRAQACTPGTLRVRRRCIQGVINKKDKNATLELTYRNRRGGTIDTDTLKDVGIVGKCVCNAYEVTYHAQGGTVWFEFKSCKR